jgi:hypothetical protein
LKLKELVDEQLMQEVIAEAGPVTKEEALELCEEAGVWAPEYSDALADQTKKASLGQFFRKTNPDTGLPHYASIKNDEGEHEYIFTQGDLFRASDYYSTKWRDYYVEQAKYYADKAVTIERIYGLTNQPSLNLEYLRDEEVA